MAILINPETFRIDFDGDAFIVFKPLDTSEELVYSKEINKCYTTKGTKIKINSERMTQVKITTAKAQCIEIGGFNRLITKDGEKVEVPVTLEEKDLIPKEYWLTAWTEIESRVKLKRPDQDLQIEFEEMKDPNA